MNLKANALLKALVSLSDNKDELLRFLPAKLAEEVQGMPTLYSFNTTSLLSTSAWTKHIHYSWFADLIMGYPTQVKLLFMGALNYPQARGIQQILDLNVEAPEISPFLRLYLLNILQQALQEPDLLDEELLPASPLNILLKLEKKHLFHVADLLGIHDLATDVRQIVDRELLRRIYNALSEVQMQFLHYCSKQPIRWVSKKLDLQAWDGSKKRLNHLIHHRGLIRLAKGIAQEDSNFKWHLLHRMDTGRAKVIQNELYSKQDPALVPYFKTQVLHIAKRYRT